MESAKVHDEEIAAIKETNVVTVESSKIHHEIVPVEEIKTVAKETTTEIVTNAATDMTKITCDVEKEKPEEEERRTKETEIIPVSVKETEIDTVERVHEIVLVEETEKVTVENGKVSHEIVPIEETETVAKETTAEKVTNVATDVSVPVKETEIVNIVKRVHKIVPVEDTEIVTVENGKVNHEIVPIEETETVAKETTTVKETETVDIVKRVHEIVPVEDTEIVTVENGKVNHEIVPIEETETVEKETTTEKVTNIAMDASVSVKETETVDPVKRVHEIVPVEETEIVTVGNGKVNHEIVPVEETEIATVKNGKVNHEIVPIEETETVTKETKAKTVTNVATDATKITWDVEKEEPKEKKKRPSICGRITQVILRLLVVGSMASACLIMLFKEQTVEIGGFRIRASYRVSPAFKFFIIGTGAVALYSMVSISMVYCRYRAKSVHILDMLMMALAMASASAATAVGYIAKFGNEQAGWAKSCDYYESYCLQSTVSIGCAYLGFVCLLVVCIMSSNPPPSTKSSK